MSGLDESSRGSSRTSKRPPYSRFTQQELPGCKPILTPGMVIGILIVLAIVFIPIGLSTLSASENVVELIDRYDELCVPQEYLNSLEDRTRFIRDGKVNKTCYRTLIIPKRMQRPVYVYYQLDNFYQNHRRYVKSRSDRQIREPKYEHDTGICAPEGVTKNNEPIVPCGLVAWSLFNDTYVFSKQNSSLTINKKDLSWPGERKKKFGSHVYPKNFQSGDLIGGAKLDEKIPLSEQEDLIVWMRTSALPTFRKLYGKIETDLEADEKITVEIQNNYNTYSYDGKKTLVISTASWVGGKNDFLGKMYMTVGGTSLCLAIVFILLYIAIPRPLGDTTYLSWNRVPML
ncbi:ALA-interacting subunit 1-like [Andrographis paniculata]|uniref:ALA-interacting subunit 1-like n=1 Tax=Andrographis paniculata TaxID=175694 RepID=UPI0021E99F09|nr:ALA-interacting subunit 1-like [Andrographis paniculata]XP_051133027.1 ALA-interacting subunit 1-like [Andrographis paniculata]